MMNGYAMGMGSGWPGMILALIILGLIVAVALTYLRK